MYPIQNRKLNKILFNVKLLFDKLENLKNNNIKINIDILEKDYLVCNNKVPFNYLESFVSIPYIINKIDIDDYKLFDIEKIDKERKDIKYLIMKILYNIRNIANEYYEFYKFIGLKYFFKNYKGTKEECSNNWLYKNSCSNYGTHCYTIKLVNNNIKFLKITN